jgi:hypothetical protein
MGVHQVNIAYQPEPVTLHQAAGVALIALAIKTGADPAARKANLCLLYETGAIDGACLEWAIAKFELRNA